MTETKQGLGTFVPHRRAVTHGPHGWTEVHGNEFYAKFTGMELRNFPDVPIKSAPLLDTSTHKLAIETDPRWTMVIRHVGSWRVKSRPKVRIYPEGMAFGKVSVCFKLPAAHRFETPESAFRALSDVDFTLSPHNLNLVAVQKQQTSKLRQELEAELRKDLTMELRSRAVDLLTEEEVFALLTHYTNERRSKLPRPKRRAPASNVLDFEALRRRITAIIEEQDESADDYAHSISSAAG
jgi:hypothetical protein